MVLQCRFPLFHRTPRDTICAVYGAIVAQARRPAFYLAYGVADIPTCRFAALDPKSRI
jgi:hypothetical protein